MKKALISPAKAGETIAAPQGGIELKTGGQPRMDEGTGKEILQFATAALASAENGREVRPADER